MRFIWFLAAIFGVAAVAIGVDGCGSSNSGTEPTVMCGNSDACQASDPACTRACGRNQTMLCQCGTGALEGTLVCGPCSQTDAGAPGTGGAMAGTGGAQGTGGRQGRGTGGVQGTGGRMGRGTGGAQGTGGRMGRGTGGTPGTGGTTTPSDGGIASCPADAMGGGVACMANNTPICQTACVNSMLSICTCSGGMWNCPATGIPCQ